MLVLTPAGLTVLLGQFRRQRHHLAQAIADQARLGGIMDVRLHHKGVTTHRLDRLRRQLVSRRHNQVVDLLQRFRLQQTDVVANPPPIKIHLLLPVANAHHQAQGAVLLGQVLQFVVIEVATQAHRRQHHDGPVTQAGRPSLGLLPPLTSLPTKSRISRRIGASP